VPDGLISSVDLPPSVSVNVVLVDAVEVPRDA